MERDVIKKRMAKMIEDHVYTWTNPWFYAESFADMQAAYAFEFAMIDWWESL